MEKYAQNTIKDRDWWIKVGDKLNLTLTGWTFRLKAEFLDNVTGDSVFITGAVAERLMKLHTKGEDRG